jgi:hypothetical protein
MSAPIAKTKALEAATVECDLIGYSPQKKPNDQYPIMIATADSDPLQIHLLTGLGSDLASDESRDPAKLSSKIARTNMLKSKLLIFVMFENANDQK